MSRPSRSNGIALVSVLWLLLLLSGLAATVSYTARVEALLARRAFDVARAQAAADAAIVDTISRLSDEDVGRHPIIGAPQSWEFDGISITITVFKEVGRIDVNAGKDELLLAFLQATGSNSDSASTLVGNLRNWQKRNGDSLRTSFNSTTTMQLTPLLSINELRRVPGWRDENLDCRLNSLTIYSGEAEVAPGYATDGALAALRWMQAHNPDKSPTPIYEAREPASSSTVLGDVVRIHASASLSEVNTNSEWVGRLTGDLARPTLIMLWDHGHQTEPITCGKRP